ncbi:MAG: 3-carboxy-cis,cis-muconate cycloisomerase, partial [Candidatus Binatia bacterium]
AVFALANAMPRAQAEDLVKKACAFAVAENKSLIDIVKRLAGDSAIAIDWQALAKPDTYLGETDNIIDRVLKGSTKKGGRVF